MQSKKRDTYSRYNNFASQQLTKRITLRERRTIYQGIMKDQENNVEEYNNSSGRLDSRYMLL